MKISIILSLLSFGIVSSLFAQSPNTPLEKSSNNVSLGYLDDFKDLSSSVRVAVSPCVGYDYSPTKTFQPGMFVFDGDLESFASSSHGIDRVCVSTDFLKTHNIATLQDNTCTSSTWKASHGTPELGINQNNHFVHIWSGDWANDGDFEGEGIFYDCPLFSCAYYNISLKLSSKGTISKIYFYAASGLQHKVKDGNEFNAESAFYKVPSVTSSQLLHTITNFNSGSTNNWVSVNIPIFKPNSSDMKLWIFTEDTNVNVGGSGQSPDLLYIDEVNDGIIGSFSTCSGSINYNGSASVPSFSKAFDITASTSVINNGPTEFIAGSYVSLTSGFTGGPDFKASIIQCATSNNCPSILPFSNARVESQTENRTPTTESINDMVVYPNPASDYVYIGKLENEEIKTISLFSLMTGQEFILNNFNKQDDGAVKVEFVLKSLKGISVLKIKTDKNIYFKKIIVE